MDNFKLYADRARREGDFALARRIETEGEICAKLVRQALADGLAVSVNDGEEWTVLKSTDFDEIMAELFTTDSNTLTFRDAEGRRVGSVELIYGNEAEVISDYSAPTYAKLDRFTVWLGPVTKYAETLENT